MVETHTEIDDEAPLFRITKYNNNIAACLLPGTLKDGNSLLLFFTHTKAHH